jgi:hypothetical protein
VPEQKMKLVCGQLTPTSEPAGLFTRKLLKKMARDLTGLPIIVNGEVIGHMTKAKACFNGKIKWEASVPDDWNGVIHPIPKFAEGNKK